MHVNAASALDKSTLLYKVAAGMVQNVLEAATNIVASEGLFKESQALSNEKLESQAIHTMTDAPWWN